MATTKEILEWGAAAVVVGGGLLVAAVKYRSIGRGSPKALEPLNNPELLAARKKADASLQRITSPSAASHQI